MNSSRCGDAADLRDDDHNSQHLLFEMFVLVPALACNRKPHSMIPGRRPI